jgi:serine/threonine-protein kinase
MQQSPGAGHQEDTLWAAERQLATFIGPVAKIVVKKAASKAKNAEELYTLLSQNLEREADRQVFLAKGAEVSRQQEQRPVWAEPAAAAAAVSQPPAARGELTRESIDRAAAMLARYIGPISSVLAKKAAQRANSVSALYQLLADHVESKGDRARFLKEAGVRERE